MIRAGLACAAHESGALHTGVVVVLEGYQRKRARRDNGVKIGVADVALVSGDGLDLEPLGGCIEERG